MSRKIRIDDFIRAVADGMPICEASSTYGIHRQVAYRMLARSSSLSIIRASSIRNREESAMGLIRRAVALHRSRPRDPETRSLVRRLLTEAREVAPGRFYALGKAAGVSRSTLWRLANDK